MTTPALPASRETGRLSAYVIRNRRTLIKAAQQILASKGQGAPIKQFADAAGMSVGSVYQHFGSKEGLIEAAVSDALVEWNRWVSGVISEVEDDLERLVLPMRMILRLPSTHPDAAAMFSNCSDVITRLFIQVQPSEPYAIVKALAGAGRIPNVDVELRTRTVLASVAMLALVHFGPDHIDDAEADKSIGLILGILGIPSREAARLVNLPLPIRSGGRTSRSD